VKSSRPSSPWSIRWVCLSASYPPLRGAVLASLEFVVKFCAEALVVMILVLEEVIAGLI
jgi:hypothetical protein